MIKEALKGVARFGGRGARHLAKGALVRSAITGEPATGAAMTWAAGKAVEKIASKRGK